MQTHVHCNSLAIIFTSAFRLSKVAFTTGEKAFVHIEIANQSAVEIRSFVLKVNIPSLLLTVTHESSLAANKSNKIIW